MEPRLTAAVSLPNQPMALRHPFPISPPPVGSAVHNHVLAEGRAAVHRRQRGLLPVPLRLLLPLDPPLHRPHPHRRPLRGPRPSRLRPQPPLPQPPRHVHQPGRQDLRPTRRHSHPIHRSSLFFSPPSSLFFPFNPNLFIFIFLFIFFIFYFIFSSFSSSSFFFSCSPTNHPSIL